MSMRTLVGSLGVVCLLSSGCDPEVEVSDTGRLDAGADAPATDAPATDAPPDDGGSPDAGGPVERCDGQPDGTVCVEPDGTGRFICLSGSCVASECGDAFADPEGEACDDGNPFGGDGCEVDCTFSCTDAADCPDDDDTCNGVPSCGADHTCGATPLADDTVCTIVGTSVEGACRGGACRSGDCGDGDIDAGEDCDDTNTVDGDGCETDCTFTCASDGDCQNDTLCDGIEACDTDTHLCGPGVVPTCTDEDACTSNSCDAETGCVVETVLVDADSDGFFAVSEACGGDDCDDSNPMAYPGAPEACGGTVDLNCDGSVETPTWYADCDEDSYAPTAAQSMMSCEEPRAVPVACRIAGGWTTRAPSGRASTDCSANVAAANPGQTSFFSTGYGSDDDFDYDCNGVDQREFATRPAIIAPCVLSRTACTGTTYWDELRAPACGSTATRSSCALVRGTCMRLAVETPVRCR